jgi:hypothetical protein
MEEVKICFQKRQYKNCSARCIQILDSIKDPVSAILYASVSTSSSHEVQAQAHPLCMVWMSFYAAVSLEQVSSALHVKSTEKLPLLQQSLSYYERAQSHLRQVPYSLNDDNIQNQQCSSSVASDTFSSAKLPLSSTNLVHQSSRLLTLPLPIHPAPYPSCCNEKVATYSAEEMRLQTQQEQTAHIHILSLSHPLSRYRSQLMCMRTQICYHVGSVTKQITAVKEVREARCSKRPIMFEAFSAGGIDGMNIEEMKKAELKDRIERLRERGWKRERFDAERYQRLCEQTLAELDE